MYQKRTDICSGLVRVRGSENGREDLPTSQCYTFSYGRNYIYTCIYDRQRLNMYPVHIYTGIVYAAHMYKIYTCICTHSHTYVHISVMYAYIIYAHTYTHTYTLTYIIYKTCNICAHVIYTCM